MRALFAVALIGAALTGCQSEDEFRQRWRETAVNACVQETQRREEARALDPNRFCNCSIDKIMEGKSVAELRSYQPQSQDSEAAAQCAVESVSPPPPQRG